MRWAPPGADYVYFTAVTTALRRGAVRPMRLPDRYAESREYWREVVGLQIVHADLGAYIERFEAALMQRLS